MEGKAGIHESGEFRSFIKCITTDQRQRGGEGSRRSEPVEQRGEATEVHF